MLNVQTRKDHPPSAISSVVQDQQIEKCLSGILPDRQLTPEELQLVLQSFSLGYSQARLESNAEMNLQFSELKAELKAEINQTSSESDAKNAQRTTKLEQKLDSFVEGELERDRQMQREVGFLRKVLMFIKKKVKKMNFSVKEIKTLITSLYQDTQATLAKVLLAGVFGDVILKEMAKFWIGDEWYQAKAENIDQFIGWMEPVSDVYVGIMSFFFPTLPTKTATIIVIAAAMILNHTVSNWTPARRSLGKLRSLFTSK